jgi:hypothetical protein
MHAPCCPLRLRCFLLSPPSHRRAFELAHSTAYLFAGCRPHAGAWHSGLHRTLLAAPCGWPTSSCARHSTAAGTVDEIVASKRCSVPALCFAVEVEEVTFRRPVSVGDLLRLRSWVAHTWVAPHNRELVRMRGSPCKPAKRWASILGPAPGRAHATFFSISPTLPAPSSAVGHGPLEGGGLCDAARAAQQRRHQHIQLCVQL